MRIKRSIVRVMQAIALPDQGRPNQEVRRRFPSRPTTLIVKLRSRWRNAVQICGQAQRPNIHGGSQLATSRQGL